ncbi:MAG: glutaminyl-peptide cyclotransferase [Sediminibacterium sp.]|jgi:glutaminyl-peptide cyclotransferase|nr:glutaminyl-peptide cyclotransferase [Sediminibacterium sp.]
MLRFIKYILLFTFIITMNSCGNNTATSENNEVNENVIKAPTQLQYEVVKVYKHDTSSYTQGLEWYGETLIEGTGNYGKSQLHKMDANMKGVGKKLDLPKELFGEGITVFKDKIYQLTWKEHKVFVYNANTLQKEKEFYWPYEGWGLTHNDTALIVSTGGSDIYIVDPNTFAIKKTIGVYNNYGYVGDINELEYVDGKIFANIYGQNEVVVIDPATGQIINNINFSNLLAQAGVKYDPTTIDVGNVLNGIAYQAKSKTFFITGKCWPVMVEIKIK